jgi:hypothetical protein
VKDVRDLAVDLECLLFWVKTFRVVPGRPGCGRIIRREWPHQGWRHRSGIRPGPRMDVIEADDGDVVFTDNIDFIWAGSVHDGEEERIKANFIEKN